MIDANMRELIAGQDAVLVTVAGGMVEKDGKYIMDPDLYTARPTAARPSASSNVSMRPICSRSCLPDRGAYTATPVARNMSMKIRRQRRRGPFQQVYAGHGKHAAGRPKRTG